MDKATVRCQKITFECLGQTHICYASNKIEIEKIRSIIKSIWDTSIIVNIESSNVDFLEYESNKIQNINA